MAPSRGEAVPDLRRRGQAKVIVAALVLGVAASVGAAAYAVNTTHDRQFAPGSSNQCDLPLEQRNGGWFCPTH